MNFLHPTFVWRIYIYIGIYWCAARGLWRLYTARLEAGQPGSRAQAVSQRAYRASLAVFTYDPGFVYAPDSCTQSFYSASFEQFSGRMVPPRARRGTRLLQQYAAIFSRIEQQFDVQRRDRRIWAGDGLRRNSGKFPTVRSLASLATIAGDGQSFAANLIAAMRIVERGDMAPSRMRGAWAARSARPSSCLVLSQIRRGLDGNGRRPHSQRADVSLDAN